MQVVVAVGQAEPALVDEHGVTVRVLVVRPDADEEQRALIGLGRCAHQRGELAAVLHGLHRIEVGPHWPGALRIHRRLVHEGLVEGADLARDVLCVGLGRGLGRRLVQDGVDPGLGKVAQDVDRAVPGQVAGDLGPLQVAAVGVGEEIVPRPHRDVPPREIEAPRAVAVGHQVGGGVGGQGRCGRQDQGGGRGRAKQAGFH